MDTLFPRAIDWDVTFRPAVIAFLNGQPFDIYNPPWVLFPLIPLAVLPYAEARMLMLILGLGSFLLAARSLGAKRFGLMAALLSPFVYESIAWGNVEWLTLLGIAAIQPVGILLLLIKPQMTLGLIVFKLIQQKTWRERITTMKWVGFVFILSFVFFGWWFQKMASYVQFQDSTVNLSFFPFSLPIGIALLFVAFKFKKQWAALAASPLFSPVLTPPTWSVMFIALSGSAPVSMIASLAMWIVVAMSQLT